MSGGAICRVLSLGVVEYLRAWEMQRALLRARQEGRVGDVLVLLEHPPTYTFGRVGRREHLLLPEEALRRLGAAVYAVDRGGDVTFHGPGQIVGYPILDLMAWQPDAHLYLRTLEEVIIRALADSGISAQREPGITGVWAGEAKVAAIGVKLSRWVTSHGFALNVSTDLRYFDHIIPCGIHDRSVTSMESILGRPVEAGWLRRRLAHHFGLLFQRRMVWEERPAEFIDGLGAPPEAAVSVLSEVKL